MGSSIIKTASPQKKTGENKLTGSSECGPGNEMTYVQLSGPKDRRSPRLRPTREQDVDLRAASAIVDVSGADGRQQCPSNGRQRTLEYGPLNPAAGDPVRSPHVSDTNLKIGRVSRGARGCGRLGSTEMRGRTVGSGSVVWGWVVPGATSTSSLLLEGPAAAGLTEVDSCCFLARTGPRVGMGAMRAPGPPVVKKQRGAPRAPAGASSPEGAHRH